ncbi:nucleotidyltransferase [Flavobacterium sp.]|uniref:nucleotidyltransferase domain-containing protein n=1 Tax=Flavobacterium sp. TaxID=239 RepID=UPI0038D1383A
MLTTQQKQQFSEILDELGQTLDISETEFNAAVSSYNAVGNWLSNENSALAPYKPEILPQGSFLLGTAIKPISDKDDIDIDIVCKLTGKNPNWTQANLKKIVGDRLKENDTYKQMLDEEGRRCWTLEYRKYSQKNDQYHMDVLPAIIASGYSVLLEKAFSNMQETNVDSLAIRITDNLEKNYSYETNQDNWLKSNPFGYAKWFINQATVSTVKMFSLNEAVKPVPKYQSNKLPLQRVVQILKRHRDMMFDGDSEKPISIIITTLAAKAYKKQTNILDALIDVINEMHIHIEERYDATKGVYYKFIGNPVNSAENFADKWRENPNKQKKFYSWLETVKKDLKEATEQTGSHKIMERLSTSFGDREVKKAFSNIGDRARLLTEQGKNRFDTALGLTSMGASTIKPHNFYGSED